ncbi:hypothetical protein BDN70DRAFT_993149 [Pholiota conissans]|uniref:Uncharacterized protein n=1 Tax=Pholiota conissans TaxID=109636 RepID=A0A9P5Z435_9AGAR|nr:hypothetical protein BDN70DRAFT_993149 [Pholiota conissans]
MAGLNGTDPRMALSLISITDDIEKSEISTTFDAVMLEIFYYGNVYNCLYWNHVHLQRHYSATKTTSRHLIIAAAVTILYLCSLLKLGLAWYSAKHALIDHGDSRDSIFLALYDGLHFFIVNYVNVIIATIAGDGLLIWRCFNLWGRSYRIITMPIFLVVLEAGITGGALASSVASMDIFDNLIAAGLITSASNTIMATALIAYLSSFLTLQFFFARKFQHTVDIIIQSGAVY